MSIDIRMRDLDTVSQYQLEQAFVNQAVGLISHPSLENVKKNRQARLEIHIYFLEDTRGSQHLIDKLKRGIKENCVVLIDGDKIRFSENFPLDLQDGSTISVELHSRNKPVSERQLQVDLTSALDDLLSIMETLKDLAPEKADSHTRPNHDSLRLVEHEHQLVPKEKRDKRKKEALKKAKNSRTLNQESLEQMKEELNKRDFNRELADRENLSNAIKREKAYSEEAWVYHQQQKSSRG